MKIQPESYTVYQDIYNYTTGEIIFPNDKYITWLSPPKVGDKVNTTGLYYSIITDIIANYSKKDKRQIKINRLLKNKRNGKFRTI